MDEREINDVADKMWAYSWDKATPQTKREFGRAVAHAAIYGVPAPREDIERVARMLYDDSVNSSRP